MRYTTAGESHGAALVALVSDVPSGIPLDAVALDADLARRQRGYGRGGRMTIETDTVTVLSGVRFGRTLGTPVAMLIANRDAPNWAETMRVWGARGDVAAVTTPRPGHADLPGCQRTATADIRDVLERASARETAARVAAGGVARAFLGELGVTVRSWVERIGEVTAGRLDPADADAAAVESSDVRCPDVAAATAMRDAIESARTAGDSLGGVFVVCAEGVVPGLGGYAEASARLDARLAAAVMSVPAIKGVEIGLGFAAAALPGSCVHDPIVRTSERGLCRASNRAGGIEGGMSNGEAIVVRAAMKPIPTLMRALATVDLATGLAADAARERSDVCAVPAAGVVAEAEVALVLAEAYQDAFGRTCCADIQASLAAYRSRIAR